MTRNFPTWKDSHQHPTILYTDTSSNKTNLSGWVLDSQDNSTRIFLHEGSCNIGLYTDIIEAEIYAIIEGIDRMNANAHPNELSI